jgi:endosialidase-like protein
MRSKPLLILVLSACVFLAAPGGANAETSAPEVLAKVSAGQYGVEWHPTVDYEAITLTVSGPDGSEFRREFSSNEFPSFDFYGKKDRLLPDGVYTYELTVSPVLDPQTRKALNAVREWKDRGKIAERFRKRGALPERDLTQSGTFSFKGGKVLLADAAANKVPEGSDSDIPSANKDVVHLDDVIVSFSQCVGNDCVNGESFGFDTIRLKENNLRIHFQDTSSSASFPTNDWRIMANDSSNGGGNYLAFEDSSAGTQPFRVDAGAGANALRVDSQGDVGVGIANPVVELHVADGDTPTLRLEQNGTSGFTPQTWDLAGNETNFFLRDASNGSKLPFRVQPNSPQDSLTLRADNRVGLGTWSPATDLHLRRTSGSAILRLENNTDGEFSGIEFAKIRSGNENRVGGAMWVASDTSTVHSDLILQSNTATAVGNVVSSGKRLTVSSNSGFLFDGGNVGIGHTSPSELLVVGADGLTFCDGTSWNEPSSRDVKKNVEELSRDDLAELVTVLDGVDVVKFQYKNESDDAAPRVGMIAEEMPDVLASKDGKSLSLGRHVGFLMGVVKAMHEQNKQLSQEVSELKSQMEILTTDRRTNSEM